MGRVRRQNRRWHSICNGFSFEGLYNFALLTIIIRLRPGGAASSRLTRDWDLCRRNRQVIFIVRVLIRNLRGRNVIVPLGNQQILLGLAGEFLQNRCEVAGLAGQSNRRLCRIRHDQFPGRSTYHWWRMSAIIRGLSPGPLRWHICLGDGTHPPEDSLRGQIEGADPGRIPQAIHMAHLVNPALQGAHPAVDEGADKIIRRESLMHEHVDESCNIICFWKSILGVILPVDLPGRGLKLEHWKVDPVSLGIILHLGKPGRVVLHVEEHPLPLPAGVQHGDLGDVGGAPG